MHRRFLFDFEPKHRVLYWSLEGRLTDEYFREGRTEVARLVPKLLPLRAAIADFSDVLAFEVSNPTILEIANSPSLVPDTTTNIIVAPERHLYGLGRMFSVLAEKTRPNLRVLRTREEAIELLGLKDPRFEPVSL